MAIETLDQLAEVEKKILSELSRRLREFLDDRLVRLVLFGSKARGDSQKESDLDVAIIVRDLDSKLKDKIYTIVAEIEFEYSQSIASIAFSDENFQDLLNRERRIVLDIINEGIPI